MKGTGRFMNNVGTIFLPIIVAVLVVTVGVESWLLYRMYKQQSAATPGEREAAHVENRAPLPAASARDRSRDRVKPSGTADPFAPFEAWTRDLDEWDPFAEMERMRQEMDRLFESSLNRFRRTMKAPMGRTFAFAPEMDLSDNGDEYMVRFDLPGIDKSNITVKLEDRVLTVQGGTMEERAEKQGGRVIRTERRSGQFSRSVMLPGPVRSEGMKANYENGVLTIRIPKAEQAVGQKIITL